MTTKKAQHLAWGDLIKFNGRIRPIDRTRENLAKREMTVWFFASYGRRPMVTFKFDTDVEVHDSYGA